MSQEDDYNPYDFGFGVTFVGCCILMLAFAKSSGCSSPESDSPKQPVSKKTIENTDGSHTSSTYSRVAVYRDKLA